MAGYSGTPLAKKLGFSPGSEVFISNPPTWYEKWAATNDIVLLHALPATHAHIFFHSLADVTQGINNTTLTTITHSLWVSWPKKSSKVPTDLTEQTFRDVLLPLGWVDSKVAAIDETWSGLKFTRRKSIN